MKIRILSIIFFASLLFLVDRATCIGFSDPLEGKVRIEADTIIHNTEEMKYYARGHVSVTQGKISITADRITYDVNGALVIAEGNVVAIDEGGDILTGESLSIKMDEKTGVVTRGRIFFKEEHVRIAGEVIRKTGNETYEIEKSTFTTCDCEAGERPAWSFYSKNASVTVGEFLNAWHNYFNIKGVPVLYFPYLSAPVKRKRQSGFLTPKIGYSRLRGIRFDNSFFWAISESRDATFYLDLEERRGVGKGLEYRYIRNRESEGEFYLYHFKEKDIERVRDFRKGVANLSRPKTAKDDRWQLKYRHRELMPYGFVFKADVNLVSDDEYFVDFGSGEERSQESVESTLSISKSWENYNLVAEIRYFDNLLVGDDKTTLQRLPEVKFTRSDHSIYNTAFYLSMDTSFVNFERNEGMEGQRLDINPRISFPFNPKGYVEITPSIAPRETLYWVKNNPEGRFQGRSIFDARVDFTTTFIKVIPLNIKRKGLQKLRHIIRPKLTYTYIPELLQDHLPSFDSIDRINKRNEIEYMIISILTGRFKRGDNISYRDYVYLDLRESYDINEATRSLVSSSDKRRPFSAIKGELILKPEEWLDITGRGRYNPYNGLMEDYDTSLYVHDERGDSAYLTYRFIKDSVEYLDASIKFIAMKSVDVTYRNRYSYNANRSIETVYGLLYKHQCWNTEFTYTSRVDEKAVMLTFNLLGLGRVGGLSTKFEGR